MIERFQGDAGRERLIEALRTQSTILGDNRLAKKIANAATLKEYQPGERLLQQGATDNHMAFIVAGKVAIEINGRAVNYRSKNQHVGEMALIDPSAPRSASVVAIETTVTAEIGEENFVPIANATPDLWRRLAVELGERLRQRNDREPPMNDVPILFVGSSAESLPIAREIQSGLDHDRITVTVWSEGVFGASSATMESLEAGLLKADFAVLVLGPDDQVISRDAETDAPRDNVIFELGLFMGALKRERTYFVLPREKEIKIPSDLFGVTPLTYDDGGADDLTERIGPVCNAIRKLVTANGPK